MAGLEARSVARLLCRAIDRKMILDRSLTHGPVSIQNRGTEAHGSSEPQVMSP